MKKIEQITILAADGTPRKLITEKGPVDANTLSIIESAIDNYPYQHSKDIMRGFKIMSKLEVKDNYIELEDADFEWVKEKCETWPPIVQAGLKFLKFFELLEGVS